MITDTTYDNTYDEILKSLESYPAVLDVRDVKQILRIGRDSSYKLMRSGQFKVIKIGNNYKVAKPVFAKYLQIVN